MRHGVPFLLAALLAACSHRTPPASSAAAPHYVTGAAYQLGGLWSYPREQFRYDATGLAERLPARSGLTADGEMADATAMTGAHRTLQLPAIVDVTNLENGRQIRIRLNDRGPARPGRLLGLTPRAADLLGVGAGPAPVRIELDQTASEALRDQLGGAPRGITAAPVGVVTREQLPAPGQPRVARVADVRPVETAPASIATLERLPETVRQTPLRAGQLWIRVGQFTQRRYAERLRNKMFGLPVDVRREPGSGQPGFVVMAGPFATAAAADAALDQVRAAGVTDAPIVVE